MSQIQQMEINSIGSNSRSESKSESEGKKEEDMGDTDSDMVFEKLKKNKFKQQAVAAWRPAPTVASTTGTFSGFGIVFIAIGLVIIKFTNMVYEKTINYSDSSACPLGQKCNITFTIDQDVESPILMFYELDNYYQNYRYYVNSRNDKQLKGQYLTSDEAKSCWPATTNKEMGKTKSYKNNITLDENATAIPCGFIARTMFNDDFTLYKKKGEEEPEKITINEKDIAWESDKSEFNNTDHPEKQWLDMTDEHFIVWMRPAGFPSFRKIWGRIEKKLTKGEYLFEIDNKYNHTDFKGSKLIVLSTVNYFGGKNSFLGISYVVVGSICLLCAIIWVIVFGVFQRKNLATAEIEI